MARRIDTNLNGAFYVIRAVSAVFLANRGQFVSVSSIAKDGISGQAITAQAKRLVVCRVQSPRNMGYKGITSNVFVPGMFETDMVKETLSENLRKFCCCISQKRMGHLDELAEVALFLGSDAASFVNGQVINVTGGLDWRNTQFIDEKIRIEKIRVYPTALAA